MNFANKFFISLKTVIQQKSFYSPARAFILRRFASAQKDSCRMTGLRWWARMKGLPRSTHSTIPPLMGVFSNNASDTPLTPSRGEWCGGSY